MNDPTSTRAELPEFLTVDEAAGLLRVNRKTIYESIWLGQMPGAFASGKRCGSAVPHW